MRVLFNGLQAANRSGTGRYSLSLLKALLVSSPAVEVEAALPENMQPLPGLAAVHRGPVHPLWRVLYEHGRLPGLGHASLMHFPANFGPLRSARPVVITVHDLSFFRNPEWFRPSRARYYQALARYTVPRARRILADSECTRADLARYLRVPGERVDVIPLGVDDAFAPPDAAAQASVRQRYELPESYFLYAGTQEPRKNIPRIIEAWSSIAADCPWDLVIAGRVGWKNGPVQAALSRVRDRHRVHFPGYVADADLPAVMGAARAFVWPSLFEGFGLPPLEAMACGTPVITSSTSSLPEVVGDHALCVDPDDTASIALAMRRIAEDDALRADLARGGRDWAARFTWRETAARTLESYRRALG